MKIFFGYTQLMAVAHYRFFSFAKYLRQMKGVEVAYSKENVYDNLVFQWQNHLQEAGVLKQLEMLTSTADVSVMGLFNNPMGVAFMQAIQEKYKKPMLTEIDDYVFGLPAYNIASTDRTPGGTADWISQKQLEVSDGLIVSTETLKKQYEQFNKKIYVVRNGVDFDIWDNVKRSPKRGDKIRIGFTGSPNHTGDIRMIRDALIAILGKYPNVELYFKGCVPTFFPDYKRIKTDDDFTPIDKFPQALADIGMDIGIAPLKDNNFNRGKSNLRWMELSALQIPCVASPSNAYKESIVDGKTGFIADTKEEWIEKLSALIENAELRKTIGNNAYLEVKNNHDVKDRAKEYLQILKEVSDGQRGLKRRNKKVSARH